MTEGPESQRQVDTRTSLRAQLVGHWTLVSLEIVNGIEIGYAMGRDVIGVIAYDESGQMAVQFMNRCECSARCGDVCAMCSVRADAHSSSFFSGAQ